MPDKPEIIIPEDYEKRQRDANDSRPRYSKNNILYDLWKKKEQQLKDSGRRDWIHDTEIILNITNDFIPNTVNIFYTQDASNDNFDKLLAFLEANFIGHKIILDTGYRVTVNYQSIKPDIIIDLPKRAKQQMILNKLAGGGKSVTINYEEFEELLKETNNG